MSFKFWCKKVKIGQISLPQVLLMSLCHCSSQKIPSDRAFTIIVNYFHPKKCLTLSRAQFHQRFFAFFVRKFYQIKIVTRKKTFVRKIRTFNVGEIDSWWSHLKIGHITNNLFRKKYFKFTIKDLLKKPSDILSGQLKIKIVLVN